MIKITDKEYLKTQLKKSRKEINELKEYIRGLKDAMYYLGGNYRT